MKDKPEDKPEGEEKPKPGTPGVNPFAKDEDKPDDEKPDEAEPEDEPADDPAPGDAPQARVSEVTKAVRALQSGERTIEDVEQMFKTRSWPRPQTTPTSATDAFKREIEDREPDAPGSFSEVAQAFYAGVIDVDTYERLANAAKAAPKQAPVPAEDPAAEDTEGDETDPDSEKPQVTDGADEDTDGDKPDDEKPKPGTPGVNPFKKKG